MRAPKCCSEIGCTILVHDGKSRCPAHRGESRWAPRTGTSRTGTKAHKARRARILRRDPLCKLAYPGCTGTSTVADHIRPLAANGADTESNMQGACRSCSDKKTSQEAHFLAGHDVPCPWPTRGGFPGGVQKNRHHPLMHEEGDHPMMSLSRDHPQDTIQSWPAPSHLHRRQRLGRVAGRPPPQQISHGQDGSFPWLRVWGFVGCCQRSTGMFKVRGWLRCPRSTRLFSAYRSELRPEQRRS
jgi:5-methylcytosine-specific restriction protein A